MEPTVSRWKNRVKGALKDGRKGRESAVRDVLGQNETVGWLIERVANRFAGTCIGRRDIVNRARPWEASVGVANEGVIDVLAPVFLTRRSPLKPLISSAFFSCPVRGAASSSLGRTLRCRPIFGDAVSPFLPSFHYSPPSARPLSLDLLPGSHAFLVASYVLGNHSIRYVLSCIPLLKT